MGYPDYLGYMPKGTKMLPFEEARAHVRDLGFTTIAAWEEWRKSGKRPTNVPCNPNQVYHGIGWLSYPDWLGCELKPRLYLHQCAKTSGAAAAAASQKKGSKRGESDKSMPKQEQQEQEQALPASKKRRRQASSCVQPSSASSIEIQVPTVTEVGRSCTRAPCPPRNFDPSAKPQMSQLEFAPAPRAEAEAIDVGDEAAMVVAEGKMPSAVYIKVEKVEEFYILAAETAIGTAAEGLLG